MTIPTEFDILTLTDSLIKKDSTRNRKELLSLIESFQSRVAYSAFYYREYESNSQSIHLLKERCDSHQSKLKQEDTIRTAFEAYILAFIQNIHAICDSLPYFVSKLYKDFHLKEHKIGWNNDFFTALKKEISVTNPIYIEIQNFHKHIEFIELKGIVNKAKHQSVVRVSNHITNLEFDDFDYFDSDKKTKVAVKNLDVFEFIKICNDDLLLKIFKLYETIEKNS